MNVAALLERAQHAPDCIEPMAVGTPKRPIAEMGPVRAVVEDRASGPEFRMVTAEAVELHLMADLAVRVGNERQVVMAAAMLVVARGTRQLAGQVRIVAEPGQSQ